MPTLYENYNTGDTQGYAMGSTMWRAQSFQPERSHDVSQIALKLLRSPGEPRSIVVELWPTVSSVISTSYPATTASGTPLGSAIILNSAIITGTATYAGTFITAVLSVANLVNGTIYAVILKPTFSVGTVVSTLAWRYDNTPAYSAGCGWNSVDDGGSWVSNFATMDNMFEVYGDPSPPRSNRVYSADKKLQKRLVAFAGNEVWYESTAGTMAEMTAAREDIDTTLPLNAFEGFGKVFIANCSNLRVLDFVNIRCATTAIGSAALPHHGNLLTGGTSGAEAVVDYVNAAAGSALIYMEKITSTAFTSGETLTGTNDDGGSISFAITSSGQSPPHWYNWTRYANNSLWGVMPAKAIVACLYRGRAVLAGNADYPHQWYMSRQADTFDFNYIANDAQSPVAGQDADAGELGDIVVALIPRRDDYLIVGCVNSMWMIRGDPAAGGTLDELSLAVGIFGSRSWCWDSEDNLYFWGTNGLYRLTVGREQSSLELLTKISLPNIFIDEALDPTLYRITLGYDRRRHGILCCITKVSDGSNSNYWYDLRTEGFFPESYPTAQGIYSLHYYQAHDDDYQHLLLGCKDGYIKYFLDTQKDDDGTTISSEVVFSPQAIASDPIYEGRILGSTIIAAGGASGGEYSDTDGFTLKFHTGKDPETAAEKALNSSTAFLSVAITGGGRKTRIREKIAGAYIVPVIQSLASQTWGFERLIAETQTVGRVR